MRRMLAGIHGVGETERDSSVTSNDTTVEDELALVIGVALGAGLTPNRIAHLLVVTGWENPTLPYLAELEATRP